MRTTIGGQMQASGGGAARTDGGEPNEIQGILIRSVRNVKDFRRNVILIKRRSNAKDFDRGC
jgi:hypothetical protein